MFQSFFDEYIKDTHFELFFKTAEQWYITYVKDIAFLEHVAFILLGFILAGILKPIILRLTLPKKSLAPKGIFFVKCQEAYVAILFPLLSVLILSIYTYIISQITDPHIFLTTILKLLMAWIVIRFTIQFLVSEEWQKMTAFFIWFIACFFIFGWINTAVIFLDAISIKIGDFEITAFMVIKTIIFLLVFLWLAVLVSSFFERQIKTLPGLNPSTKVLTAKILRIFLIIIAFVIVLNSLGIDLTVFAVFSGALGLGIGIGLQKIASNFISGITILIDRSIKPGDVISVGDTYGWVNHLRARYVSVVTRDGAEHIIPNEDIITKPLINWSYSNKYVRVKTTIGVSYDSDLDKAIELCLKACEGEDRILDLKNHKPISYIEQFGDSAVQIHLSFWINDPENGMANLRSKILIKIWRLFKEHNIKIPFPQRDIHIKSLPEG